MNDEFPGELAMRGGRGRVGAAHPRRWLSFSLLVLLCTAGEGFAQHQDKPRPEAWEKLAAGGRFMDRILPAPIVSSSPFLALSSTVLFQKKRRAACGTY